MSQITFFSEEVDFQLGTEEAFKRWLINVIGSEERELGELNYIFCSDEYLYKINLEYLNHDTYTDIITFNYCKELIIGGDVFISIDRVRENASEYKTNFLNELQRVLVHGLLHLIGYNDKSKDEKKIMRSKEDFYLSSFSN